MLQRFLALSRSAHGILDIAMPSFVALLWLGHFPSWDVLAVSLITVFAGYTAIYALNDLVGFKHDKAKFSEGEINAGYSVEASNYRHPLAQGVLSHAAAWSWFGAWFVVAMAGSYWLNPPIIFIVLGAGVLEVIYCLLLKITYWRVLVSGLVKAAGPVAAVYVVIPEPSLSGLALMVAWIICWEIGGQNIPADWNDGVEDQRIGARTIPQTFGFMTAGRIALAALIATVGLSLCLPAIAGLELGWGYRYASVLAGFVLLIWPALRLHHQPYGRQAARLFDMASYYPLAHLAIILIFVLEQF